MSDEDEYLTNYIKQNPNVEDYWLEVPYNHYGSRGFVDAVLTWQPEGDNEPQFYEIIEVKSESAIRNATGANEIIRQVNKMMGYFVDSQVNEVVDTENYGFRLDIVDTEHTRQHLLDNYDLYQSIHDSDPGITPRSSVRLVSKEGEKLTEVHNLREWVNEGDEEGMDIRNPQKPVLYSILNPDKEPEDETFCYRHGRDRLWFKPVVKFNEEYHVLPPEFRAFYCPHCLIEVSDQGSGDGWEKIKSAGGFHRILGMLFAKQLEDGEGPFPDLKETFGTQEEAQDYTMGENTA